MALWLPALAWLIIDPSNGLPAARLRSASVSIAAAQLVSESAARALLAPFAIYAALPIFAVFVPRFAGAASNGKAAWSDAGLA